MKTKFDQLTESILNNEEQIPQEVINKIKEHQLHVAKETGENVNRVKKAFTGVKTKRNLISALFEVGYEEKEAESLIRREIKKVK